MIQESCEYNKGRAIKLHQHPEVVRLKPEMIVQGWRAITYVTVI